MGEKPLVVVTGASGFIAGHVAEGLAGEFRIVGLDTKPPKDGSVLADFVRCDLGDEASVQAAVAALPQGSIAGVVHLAAYFDLEGEDDERYRTINVEGTQRLLSALESRTVELFIFSSTMLVHEGTAPGERITETSPTDADMPYERSKLACEHLLASAEGPERTLVLRIAGVYDDLCRSAFLAHQIARIHERSLKSRFYPADLATGQSFLHVDDLADAVLLAVQRRTELPEHEILLIGEEEAIGYGDMQDRMGRLIHGEDWTTLEVPAVLAKVGAAVEDAVPGLDPFIKPWMVDLADESYVIDGARARERLGWTPRHSLAGTLPRMVAALKRDPDGWYAANKLDG